ncbi:DUF2550 domain-containing protein [Actinoplanes sp. URMC 104]|uniref:DUF2550 domain-containing protein n=1 Tax=Actinoplanes sp. URMC 104 TaxID=3423409 RepID=UPI003F1B5989
MRVLEVLGICVGALFALVFLLFFRGRLLMVGGGTIRLQIRVSTLVPGRGWSPAIGQFAGGHLRIHRLFSFAVRPKRTLDRGATVVEDRRRPEGPERLTMPAHWVILRLATTLDEFEIAMAESTVTGFLSWLEAAPPGQPGSVAPRPVIRPHPLEP